MSRSYRKNFFFGHTTARSEKADKTRAHHVERAVVRASLTKAIDLEAVVLPEAKQAFSNVYTFAKDGKSFSLLRLRHFGRSLLVLKKPHWLKTNEEVHRAIAK